MAGDGDRSRSLKEALYESLIAILSPEQAVRAAGEEQVKALEVTEEFGSHLAEFTVDPQVALAVRQLASVLLKQYVEAHWSQHSDKFRAPETSEAAKAAIRQILPLGLKESISKVRSSVAYAVSAIAHWDWPEAWPGLFHILMEALTTGNSDAVHGAMRVLTEFCREVTDMQVSQVAPVILPEMYKIFTQAEVYSVRTRGRAVDIFNTMTSLISHMAEMHKNVARQLLFPVLPQFTEAFVQALQVSDGLTSDSGLKMEILKALTTLMKNYPSQMGQWLAQILPPRVGYVHAKYVRTVVNGTEEADNPVDSDGEVMGFENLIFGTFEFIHAMIDSTKFRSTVKKSMHEVVYCIIVYMQMTEDQVSLWSLNPDQFVEDEDDDTFSYSVRISAQDLLLSLSSQFPKQAAPAICQAVMTHLQEAETAKTTGQVHWWKEHEALMLALGSVRPLILESVTSQKTDYDLVGFLQTVVLVDLNQNVSPFLLGRCLWLASRYTQIMSQELLQSFLQATVSGLHPNQPATVRISAVRAVFGFCDHLKTTNNKQALQPYIADMTDGLLAIAQQFSTEVLALCLETLNMVLVVDEEFTVSVEPRIMPLATAVFLKYNGDPLIISLVQDMFKVLSENKACIHSVQQKLVPTLVSILEAPIEKIPVGMQAVALDNLQTLIRSSPVPLSELLLVRAFPAAVRATLSSDDNSVLQSGGECIRSFVSKSLEQVCEWQDGRGNSGLSYVVQIISKLLDPKTSEFTATFVGRLVSILIARMGSQLGENLDLMLRAVLSKMQQAETLSVLQSLIMVFAHLIHHQMEAVLDFLSTVPGPTGKPALEFVLTEWCSKQHLFYGLYEAKISTVALCKLLQHAIEKNDQRLQNIEVKGDQIFNPNEGIRTRSRSAQSPDEWTMIPVLIKIYKLIINELSTQIENSLMQQPAGGEDDDDEEEEGDGDWDDEEEEDMDGEGEEGETLSSLLNQFCPGFSGFDLVDDDEEEDDPDAVSDPIYQIELQPYLTEFLRSFSQQHCYGVFSQHHNECEKQVLRTIGIQV
ncbi:Importin-9 [Lamellibrachia satsuma]|nr:Importin-9 [Lamellibrachia satsuma]